MYIFLKNSYIKALYYVRYHFYMYTSERGVCDLLHALVSHFLTKPRKL